MSMREFTSAAQLRRHYRNLRARTRAWAKAPSATPPQHPADGAAAPAPPPGFARMTPLTRIVIAVAEEFELPVRKVRSPSRVATVVLVRRVIMLLAREMTNASSGMIATALGLRDHSTVPHALPSILAKLAGSPELRRKVERVRAKLLEQPMSEDADDRL